MCNVEQRYVELVLQEYENVGEDIIDSTVYNNQLLTLTRKADVLHLQAPNLTAQLKPIQINQNFTLLFVQTQNVLLLFSN